MVISFVKILGFILITGGTTVAGMGRAASCQMLCGGGSGYHFHHRRQKDPEMNSYGSEDKGKRLKRNSNFHDAGGRIKSEGSHSNEQGGLSLYTEASKNKFGENPERNYFAFENEGSRLKQNSDLLDAGIAEKLDESHPKEQVGMSFEAEVNENEFGEDPELKYFGSEIGDGSLKQNLGFQDAEIRKQLEESNPNQQVGMSFDPEVTEKEFQEDQELNYLGSENGGRRPKRNSDLQDVGMKENKFRVAPQLKDEDASGFVVFKRSRLRGADGPVGEEFAGQLSKGTFKNGKGTPSGTNSERGLARGLRESIPQPPTKSIPAEETESQFFMRQMVDNAMGVLLRKAGFQESRK